MNVGGEHFERTQYLLRRILLSTNSKQTNAKGYPTLLKSCPAGDKKSSGDDADAMGLANIVYVDESIRMAADPPTYLMAAVVSMRDARCTYVE